MGLIGLAVQVIKRLMNYGLPVVVFGGIAVFIAPIPTILHMIYYETGELFSLKTWQTVSFSYIWQFLGFLSARLHVDSKAALLRRAQGTVLEVGAGLGHNLRYYDSEKVDRLYALEPNKNLISGLRAAAKKSPVANKFDVVACGAEDTSGLRKAGIIPGQVDTIVCVHVLCGVPQPRKTIKALQGLLREGGEFLFLEHCLSHDPYTKLVQQIYNVLWPHVFNGCELTRPTDRWLENMPGWNGPSTHVELSSGSPSYDVVPSYMGKLMKAKYN